MAEANGGSILAESDGKKRSIFTVRFLRKE
jgi:hypothetical protein